MEVNNQQREALTLKVYEKDEAAASPYARGREASAAEPYRMQILESSN